MQTNDKDESYWSRAKNRSDSWVVGPWGGRNTVLRFLCSALSSPPSDPPARQLHMSYKFVQAEMKLLAAILTSHGFSEVPLDVQDFNLLWTGVPLKPETYAPFTAHQRVNHFPRSHELTRKDRLWKNIEKFQHSKWSKLFDFMPQTFVLPIDYRELCAAHKRRRGPWIIKPIASSRGRGINIVNHLDDIPTNENVVVSKYIDNPLLVDGHKCDVRLYVAVTSYNPLVVYVFEEGLVRFATVKYQPGGKNLWNHCMHLCNYSLNKFHSDYIMSDAEDVGHKWTLSALLHHLRLRGNDTAVLMQRIEELIVKSLLAVASSIASAVEMFVPHPGNCFEVYGFDILIDEGLKPWMLEVNYSPSIGCDMPLDMRVKSAMLVDLLTLAGFPAVDPVLRLKNTKPTLGGARSEHVLRGSVPTKGIPRCDSSRTSSTSKELRVARIVRAEFERRGGFVRIFPAQDSWQRYGSFLDPTTGFIVAGQKKSNEQPSSSALTPHNYNLSLHRALFSHSYETTGAVDVAARLGRYERTLLNGHNLVIDFVNTETYLQKSGASIDYRGDIMQCLHGGQRLNQCQVRRLFAQYLGYILKRVTGKTKEKGQAELVIQFLQKVSVNLRTPYTIQMPNPRLKGKDREAVVAKRLYDFLSVYSQETSLYAVNDDRPQFVVDRTFRPFIERANEKDLDDVLSLNTRLYNCAHLYLGRCGVNGSGGLKPVAYNEQTPTLSSIIQSKTDRPKVKQ